jgi:hypothetical protein
VVLWSSGSEDLCPRTDTRVQNRGAIMEILSRVFGGILLSFVVTSADAIIMLDPTPSGTGNNVQSNDQPPNQTGTTIFGNINDPNDTLVRFTGAVYKHSGPNDPLTRASPN